MTDPQQNKDEAREPLMKKCTYCQEIKPLTDFQRRTGRRAGPFSRRGPCRSCRGLAPQERAVASAPSHEEMKPLAAPVERHSSEADTTAYGLEASAQPPNDSQRPRRKPVTDKARERHRQRVRHLLSRLKPADTRALRLNRNGMIRLRGKTDQGRRWHQEIELDLAMTLVRERMAVIVNPYTVRRLYSNKEFRQYVLKRDRYTCFFCGGYGDTIDHLLPRAKGGHTTPVNCVCACNECNQVKAARDVEEFIESGVPLPIPDDFEPSGASDASEDTLRT
ncbi:HNH endonuclease [Paenibacillus polymyxa]|uniref:HNH endonuclease n=1 Tax=Paenibacillus TaxID=44249 RepID=UPI000F4E1B76|nr:MULTISPECIES: HNH endonuclease signature motif containing protein [Paenibacillus]KAF6657081.1 HNH endonuclease [Paenibacillus sp. EKM301P]RPD97210.1 HNH endonuclease [Paenibacillus polymyxa]UBS87105.1 HNH endonuclease [Paenibacillus polymyxa]WHX35681.1 HNH endonuclease signature motif containing protein [Paenibacillus polymyxa]